MKKSFTVLLTTALLCIFACGPKEYEPKNGPIGERPPSMHSGGGPGHMPGFQPPTLTTQDMQKIQKEIGFDEPTSRKIMDFVRSFNTQMKERIVRIQREELNVKEELLKDKPNLSLIKKAIDAKTKIFADIEMDQIKRDLNTKALLTPEQYEKWTELLLQNMRERMPGRPFGPAMPRTEH